MELELYTGRACEWVNPPFPTSDWGVEHYRFIIEYRTIIPARNVADRILKEYEKAVKLIERKYGIRPNPRTIARIIDGHIVFSAFQFHVGISEPNPRLEEILINFVLGRKKLFGYDRRALFGKHVVGALKSTRLKRKYKPANLRLRLGTVEIRVFTYEDILENPDLFEVTVQDVIYIAKTGTVPGILQDEVKLGAKLRRRITKLPLKYTVAREQITEQDKKEFNIKDYEWVKIKRGRVF